MVFFCFSLIRLKSCGPVSAASILCFSVFSCSVYNPSSRPRALLVGISVYAYGTFHSWLIL
jgi:hypothetical protein